MTKSDEISGSEEAQMMNGAASAEASSMHPKHDADDAIPPAKRGPGRPKGSPNRPKTPPLTPLQREALRGELGPAYVDALMTRMRAGLKAKGLKTLIVSKLGHDDLAEIEADVIVQVENGMHSEEAA